MIAMLLCSCWLYFGFRRCLQLHRKYLHCTMYCAGCIFLPICCFQRKIVLFVLNFVVVVVVVENACLFVCSLWIMC